MEVLVERKPEWLKIKAQTTDKFIDVKTTLRESGLNTVCEEAHCPNISECWSGGTATIMIMGKVCTRGCRFCNVDSGKAGPLDPLEPFKVAEAVSRWKLDYVVITSVDRDDLSDQGSNHFTECIKQVKEKCRDTTIEVLIPDFRGDINCIKRIVDAKPDVISHNLETVKRLQRKVRDGRANYEQSLFVLKTVKELDKNIYTKSSLMLGLGENDEEVIEAMKDLRGINVSVVTFGQYLRPSEWHLKVEEYVNPEKFEYFKEKALELGFLYCASGPFVRSSYRAGEFFMKGVINAREK